MVIQRKSLYLGTAALLTLAAVWAYSSFTPSRTQSGQAGQDAVKAAPAGLLKVTAEQARQLGIQLAPAQPAVEAAIAELPATVAPPPNARVAVTAALPGYVVRTYVAIGDTVRQGQALAEIASRDVLTLSGELARASARLRVAQTNAGRLNQLSREGIVAGARADEANALAAEARADVSEKSRILALVNGHGGSGRYTLTAPIAGRVSSATIQTGSPVDGASAPYVIDAIGKYEVEAQLPERLVGTIRPGMAIRMGDLRGTVTSVSGVIDPATRSALLKASLPMGADMVSGRAGSISVLGPAPQGAVTVPDSAVTQIDGESSVFVAVQGGFAIRTVKTGGSGGRTTLLLSGLRRGDQVVINGTSALKALALSR